MPASRHLVSTLWRRQTPPAATTVGSLQKAASSSYSRLKRFALLILQDTGSRSQVQDRFQTPRDRRPAGHPEWPQSWQVGNRSIQRRSSTS
ncbi:MAG: hypothetical protein AAF974_04575 [Cyanobacteria bacterium P01_E01_bin.34]